MTIPTNTCRRKLAILWFSASGVLYLILFVQVQLGHWGNDTGRVMAWMLPSLTPTLSLILGVFVADAVRSPGEASQQGAVNAEPFFFRLTFSISSVYLASLLLIILLQPESPTNVELLITQNNLWLVPFQALVVASMGAFFVSQKKPHGADEPPVEPPPHSTSAPR